MYLFILAAPGLCCGTWDLRCGICDLQLPHANSQLQHACRIQFPDQGLNPGPLHWEHGVLPTGPPGKSLFYYSLRLWVSLTFSAVYSVYFIDFHLDLYYIISSPFFAFLFSQFLNMETEILFLIPFLLFNVFKKNINHLHLAISPDNFLLCFLLNYSYIYILYFSRDPP